LATASDDRTVRLWDVLTHDPAAEPIVLRGHEDLLRAVAFSPDGRWLATASDDRTTLLWNMSDLEARPAVLSDHLPSMGCERLGSRPDSPSWPQGFCLGRSLQPGWTAVDCGQC
jgi:WD40 repeat protein